MSQRGHEVVIEAIQVERSWNKWFLPIPLLPLLPFLPLYLLSSSFRRFWHWVYFQPEQAISPLANPDVSGFDLVLLGTPKWLYISYPVVRWLKEVRGLAGKRVATFATFCGPPLKVFEIEMLFEPLEARLKSLGATPSSRLAVPSDFHEYFFRNEMRNLFRWISLRHFGCLLENFTMEGQAGKAEIKRFCDETF